MDTQIKTCEGHACLLNVIPRRSYAETPQKRTFFHPKCARSTRARRRANLAGAVHNNCGGGAGRSLRLAPTSLQTCHHFQFGTQITKVRTKLMGKAGGGPLEWEADKEFDVKINDSIKRGRGNN